MATRTATGSRTASRSPFGETRTLVGRIFETTILFSPSYASRRCRRRERQVVDVAYGSTNNGTVVQQWGTHQLRAEVRHPASGSNWKIAMKANTNKCFGPVDNGTANRPSSRSRIATAARPGLERDGGHRHHRHVQLQEQGGGPLHGCRRRQPKDGARLQMYDCWSGNNQNFAVDRLLTRRKQTIRNGRSRESGPAVFFCARCRTGPRRRGAPGAGEEPRRASDGSVSP